MAVFNRKRRYDLNQDGLVWAPKVFCVNKLNQYVMEFGLLAGLFNNLCSDVWDFVSERT